MIRAHVRSTIAPWVLRAVEELDRWWSRPARMEELLEKHVKAVTLLSELVLKQNEQIRYLTAEASRAALARERAREEVETLPTVARVLERRGMESLHTDEAMGEEVRRTMARLTADKAAGPPQ